MVNRPPIKYNNVRGPRDHQVAAASDTYEPIAESQSVIPIADNFSPNDGDNPAIGPTVSFASGHDLRNHEGDGGDADPHAGMGGF